MVFHNIGAKDVQPGDHLYIRHWITLQRHEAIAVQPDKNVPIMYVVESSERYLRLLTLAEFQGLHILRRALYDQHDSLWHHWKSRNTSFTIQARPQREIEQNALYLLKATTASSKKLCQLYKICGNNLNTFAFECSSKSTQYWIDEMEQRQNSQKNTTRDNSKCEVTFNLLLRCGVPFSSAILLTSSRNATQSEDRSISNVSVKDPQTKLLNPIGISKQPGHREGSTLTTVQHDERQIEFHISISNKEPIIPVPPKLTKTRPKKREEEKYFTHKINVDKIERGDHIYAYRKIILYQHHGIVVSKDDVEKWKKDPQMSERLEALENIKDSDYTNGLMVLENNKIEGQEGLRLVSFDIFRANYSIRRVQYGVETFRDCVLVNTKYAGTAYPQPALMPDNVVHNAFLLYTHMNLPYNFFIWNCEHFAFTCSTNGEFPEKIGALRRSSDQIRYGPMSILASLSAFAMVITKLVHFFKILFRAIRSVESNIDDLYTLCQTAIDTLSMIKLALLKIPNVIWYVRAVIFAIDTIPHIIRLIFYLTSKGERREIRLARGIAITPKIFAQEMMKAIGSHGLSIVAGILGMGLGIAIPVPGLNVLLSAIFSAIVYFVSRVIIGAAFDYHNYVRSKKNLRRNITSQSCNTDIVDI